MSYLLGSLGSIVSNPKYFCVLFDIFDKVLSVMLLGAGGLFDLYGVSPKIFADS